MAGLIFGVCPDLHYPCILHAKFGAVAGEDEGALGHGGKEVAGGVARIVQGEAGLGYDGIVIAKDGIAGK